MRVRAGRVVAAVVGVLAIGFLGRGFVTGEYQQAIGQAGSDIGWNNDLSRLAGSLRELDGVASVDTTFNALALPSARAGVAVRMPGSPSEAELRRVVELTAATVRRHHLPANLVTLSVTRRDGARWQQDSFELTSEATSVAIRTWGALGRATGLPLAIGVSASPEGYPDDESTITINAVAPSSDADAALVAAYSSAVADPGSPTPNTRWLLPGVAASGSLPSRDALALLATTATAAPISGAAAIDLPASGALLTWSGAAGEYASIGAIYPHGHLNARADARRADRVAAAIVTATAAATSNIQNVHVVSVSDVGTFNDYELHLGTCANAPAGAHPSMTWSNRLTGEGVHLPVGSAGGQCVPAE